MTSHRDQLVGAVGQTGEPMRHVLDEARLAASGRAFEEHRKARLVSGLEDFDLVADRQIVGGVVRVEMTDLGSFGLHPVVELSELNRHDLYLVSGAEAAR